MKVADKTLAHMEDKNKQSAFERLPDVVKQKVLQAKDEENKAIADYYIKLNKRHAIFSIVGALVYMVMGCFTFEPKQAISILAVLTVLILSGSLSAFMISKKELGSLWGIVVFGCPIIILTLVNSMVHFVDWNVIVALFSWVVILAIGAVLGHKVDYGD